MTRGKKAIIIIICILLVDQLLKFWIKTHMTLGESIPVFGNWFQIYFTENPGMAFGMQFGGEWGKLFLSLFRIFAITAMGWLLWWLCKRPHIPTGVCICIAIIFAGALGNLIDSAFYGLLFSESTYTSVAEFLPEEGGYAPFLYGKVVDMLYFPLIEGQFPEWFPVWGGEDFIFFRPIFNIADSCITIGFLSLIIFEWKFLTSAQHCEKKEEDNDEVAITETNENQE